MICKIKLNQVKESDFNVIQTAIQYYYSVLQIATEQPVRTLESVNDCSIITELYVNIIELYPNNTIVLPTHKAIVLAKALQYWQTNICDTDIDNVRALRIKKNLLTQCNINLI